ncbi:MAG: HIT family hydrolase [Chloroflexi bacterium CG08_land_8_20_14_0_20_45_12]|nr:MAG: HIT family hydrolase [Chloroflexi bacterium CG08_land_8_20_14_0_20_45_12]
MQQIWAPWRIEYIRKANEAGCILCQKPKENNDEASFILYRGKNNFVLLNIYPYNPGHLMVAPYRHTANLADLTESEVIEHFDFIKRSLELLREVLNPTGFNVGLNLGKAAGAGIKNHLHTHIVPRWEGDTNFMPVLSDTRVISEALTATYKKLKAKITYPETSSG